MSSSGKPSTVVITITGSGMANWRTISTSPSSIQPSSSERGQPLDDRARPLGAGAVEPRVDEHAVLAVHRRIDAERLLAPPPVLLVVAVGGVGLQQAELAARRRVGEQLGVAQHVDDVVVAAEEELAGRRDPPHRRLLAQRAVVGEPVLLDRRVHQVDVVDRAHWRALTGR